MKRIRSITFVSVLAVGLLLLCLSLAQGGRSSSAATRFAPAATVRVCTAGPPACDYDSLQAAVDAAVDGDVIKVAAGTYTDLHVRPRNDVTTTGVVTQVVYISKSVTIEGGYTTTNWIVSDPTANPTTLDALDQGRVVYITPAISPTLEGLRITGGAAPLMGYGGGLAVYTATTTIRNCHIISNYAFQGAGMGLHGASVLLTDSRLEGNTAFIGGGLHANGGDVTLEGNVFLRNRGNYAGGGAYFAGATVTAHNNRFTENRAAGPLDFDGGGGFYAAGPLTLTANIFYDNMADSCGGAVHLNGDHPMILENNWMQDNLAGKNGAGLCLRQASDVTVERNHLTGNTVLSVVGKGGGLYAIDAAFALTNNVVAGNDAGTGGDGVWTGGESLGALRHNTIADNAEVGVQVELSATLGLTNSIISGHDVGITVTLGAEARLDYTLWYSNAVANWSGAGAVTSTHAISGSPAFYTPGDYHITGASAALDAGVDVGVSRDVDGGRRPYGTGFDIGADELLCFRVDPIAGGTLVFTDTQGLTTTLSLPAGAVTDTTVIAFTPVDAISVPLGLASADHAFELEAYRNRVHLPDFFFRSPRVMTLTLRYSDDDVRDLLEPTLALYREGLLGWNRIGDGLVTGESQSLDPVNNLLTARLRRLSRFGSLGLAIQERLYLPLVFKRTS